MNNLIFDNIMQFCDYESQKKAFIIYAMIRKRRQQERMPYCLYRDLYNITVIHKKNISRINEIIAAINSADEWQKRDLSNVFVWQLADEEINFKNSQWLIFAGMPPIFSSGTSLLL